MTLYYRGTEVNEGLTKAQLIAALKEVYKILEVQGDYKKILFDRRKL